MNLEKRKQISHKHFEENGLKIYEYTYEIVHQDGSKTTKIVRRKVKPSSTKKYNPEENRETVLNCVNKYIEEHELKLPNLYKVTNLKPHLKPISTYVFQETQIRILIPTLKEFIQKEILLIEK